jgi:hypothetical protein
MRTAHKWKCKPGNFDVLNMFQKFRSSNDYGIPDLLKEDFVPDWLVPVKKRLPNELPLEDGAVHFFMDDYHFEVVWNKPTQILKLITDCGIALTPDFSLYVDDPIAAQIWNTYRTRWVGSYWQSQGIKVLPTVTWAEESSFDLCFLGIPKGSTVALSTVGVNRDKEVSKRFIAGF